MKNQEKLPKSFKTKFVKALLSGKFKQGTDGSLLRGNAFCCLGVGCIVAGIPEKHIRGRAFIFSDDIQGSDKVPAVLHGGDGIPGQLADLNDDGVPFEVIAGLINENL